MIQSFLFIYEVIKVKKVGGHYAIPLCPIDRGNSPPFSPCSYSFSWSQYTFVFNYL